MAINEGKWKPRHQHSGQSLNYGEGSLLPPTKRYPAPSPSPSSASPFANSSSGSHCHHPHQLLDRSKKRWTFDGVFKNQKEDNEKSARRNSQIVYASREPSLTSKAKPQSQRPITSIRDINMNFQLMDEYSANCQSRSSDGSLDGPGKKVRRNLKARVEAKRDQLCGDSSMDEASNDDAINRAGNGYKRKTRASRSERHLKRIVLTNNNHCNANHNNAEDNPERASRHGDFHSFDCKHAKKQQQQQQQQQQKSLDPPDIGIPVIGKNISLENYLCRQRSESGMNPLVQQTLKYFSEYDQKIASHRSRKCQFDYENSIQCSHSHANNAPNYSANKENSPYNDNRVVQRYYTKNTPNVANQPTTLRIATSPVCIDDANHYQNVVQHQQKQSDCPRNPYALTADNNVFNSENYHDRYTRPDNINEHRGFKPTSDSSYMYKYNLPPSPPDSPFKKSLFADSDSPIRMQNQSPILDMNKSQFKGQPQSNYLSNLASNGYHRPSSASATSGKEYEAAIKKKRVTKDLEQALNELEDIYNSLQLEDEELLDRAEQRSMEEFLYKGLTSSPTGFDDLDLRRRTWGDPVLMNLREESDIPDRLKDDMAYRRMNPKERPTSLDSQSALSSISYLMTSPIPSHRELEYLKSQKKSRKKEPDVTLDDVVFRTIHHANNSLKVIEPQPPFGIPLGPITTATESDYLHSTPTKLERARSPHVPNAEPDIVTDDLAFRNLRKDALTSKDSHPDYRNNLGKLSRNNVNRLGCNFKCASKPLASNLYGMMNRPSLSPNFDSEDQSSVQESLASSYVDSIFDKYYYESNTNGKVKKASDSETEEKWQKLLWENLDVNKNHQEEKSKLYITKVEGERISNFESVSPSCDTSKDKGNRSIDENKTNESTSNENVNDAKPSIPKRQAEPLEKEISVYNQLCEDLENLVKLTKSVDSALDPKTFENANIKLDGQKSDDADKSSEVGQVFHEDEFSDLNTIPDTDAEALLEETKEVHELEVASALNEMRILENPVYQSQDLDDVKELREKEILEDIKKTEPRATEETKETKATNSQVVESVAVGEKIAEKRQKIVDDNIFFKDVKIKKSSDRMAMSHVFHRSVQGNNEQTKQSAWEGVNKCNHKYNSMPSKSSSFLPFRQSGSKRHQSHKRKSMCSIS